MTIPNSSFRSDRDGNFEIYFMNADGSAQTRVTNNKEDDFRGSWSPDGTQIVFISLRDGNAEIYRMNTDDSEQVNLTNSGGQDVGPAWQPTFRASP